MNKSDRITFAYFQPESIIDWNNPAGSFYTWDLRIVRYFPRSRSLSALLNSLLLPSGFKLYPYGFIFMQTTR